MANRPPDLLLLDGNSLAYRAFFALPESIATSRGEPTNAIFGFSSMLVKMRELLGHVPTAVAWDAGLSGRAEIYPQYKAQRAKKPDLLRAQWPHLAPIAEAFGFANVSLEGYEADDVIGSLAVKSREKGLRTVIVTGDRDIFQLIDPEGMVAVMATGRGITDTKTYDRDAVIERYGLPPELIPDFYGLKGDTSDNIPGVPGIGDKTAAQLLQQFGDLETILSSIDQVSGAKRKENLAAHAEDARISRELARIRTDLPVELDLDALLRAQPDAQVLRETFQRFELRDPWRRLEPLLDGDGRPSGPAGKAVELPVREVALDEISAILTPFDAPVGGGTAAAEARRPVALALVEPTEKAQEGGQLFDPDAAPSDGEAAASPDAAGSSAAALRFAVARLDGDAQPIELLIGGCATPAELVAAVGDRPVVCHDAKALDTVPEQVSHDTLLAAYLLEPQRRGYPLDELADELNLAVQVEDVAGATAARIALVAIDQRERLASTGMDRLLHDVELPLVRVLRDMEREGIRMSAPRLEAVAAEVRAEIATLEEQIQADAGRPFTIGSPKQLGEVLFEELGLSKKRRGKTGFSTDARVLQAIRDEHPIVPRIERWRELSTLAKTYLDVLPQLARADPESRIHTTFGQTVAQTGRLNSSDPNLQNVPVRTALGRRIRECFEAAPGKVLLSCDYSQVELRILAYYAHEETLRKAFREDRDVHTATAMSVFGVPADELDAGQRSKAKMVNYGIAYGLTDFGLADRLDIPREEAKEMIEAYFAEFTGVKGFIDSTIEQAKEAGEVRTYFGRRRLIPELKARNPQVRGLGERYAVNTVIQGTAADIMKLAMIGVRRALDAGGFETKMILTIHDELLLEGPEHEMAEVRALVEREMIAPWTEDPPLRVEGGVGRTWVEAK
ncbi:DNA polymerase I [Patulibacter medicamentivorans]|uniref:DNA polymerase I n=1 Tax=Patulibacter medicamentivorans TaxID=1097667 RepID=H0E1W1_9ACTN|nr:DNA polymerase I [Patulibacter medicamentivorans]EHN12353.1 DNA polymerase I [Patulibacter medicamentivorans]